MLLRDELQAHLEIFHTAPFLFVGSGLPRRYLGLEDWEGLLRRFATATGRSYEYYRSSGNGGFPAIATEIARDLHPIWWNSPDFEDSRKKYSSDAKNRESALKIEISRYLENVSSQRIDNPELATELEILSKANIDGIITTNWDLLLEDLFPKFEPFVGQDELLFSASQGIGEIYKIHGSCGKPNSLVLTTKDYERYNERNAYLAAKLLTVFAEHPVIFIGYSLTDQNISSILHSITTCLTSDNIDQLRDRLIMVRWDANEASYRWEDSSLVIDGFAIPVKTVSTASFKPIFDCLAGLPRKFPARILRNLKEHVYELVHSNDPVGELFVKDIDDETDVSQVKIVYGVGLDIQLESGKITWSSEPDALPVRLSDDPGAAQLPFAPPSPLSEYPSRQAEMDALVRAWRSDHFAYIPQSRLRAFYGTRFELELSREALECLIVSCVHHHDAVHYWAFKLGREFVISLLQKGIALGLFPNPRYAIRLAFAVGMSEGEKLLDEFAKRSKQRSMRELAQRLKRQLGESPTIHSAYRSPTRSTHQIEGIDVTIDIATLFENVSLVEAVLSNLATSNDPQNAARFRQLDAYLYGTQIK